MPNCRLRLALAAIVCLLSSGASAEHHDVRIGRYQTVTVDTPPQKMEVTAHLRPTTLPEDVRTRGDALQWILTQHGFRLHEDARRLLATADILMAPVPAEARQRPAESLHARLAAVLGRQAEVLVDAESMQVWLTVRGEANRDSGEDRGRE